MYIRRASLSPLPLLLYMYLFILLPFCTFLNYLYVYGKLKQDAYKTLKVPRTATQNEIQKSYRKLARELHPDTHPDKTEEFQEVATAYQFLKDPESREKYDKYGEEGPPPAGREFPGNFFHQEFRGFESAFPGFTFHFSDGSSGRRQQTFQRKSQQRQSQSLYDKTDVKEVTNENFDSILDQEVITVLNFYHPDCKRCTNAKPDYLKLQKHLEGIVKVAAVNCEQQGSLCRKYKIDSYPQFRLFNKQSLSKFMNPISFTKQSISYESLEKWINDSTPFHGTRLSSSNFDNWIDTSGEEPVVIYFTKETAVPLILKILSLEYTSKIKIGVLPHDEKQLIKRFPIAHTFPSVVYIEDLDSLTGEVLCMNQLSLQLLSLKFSRIITHKQSQGNRYGSHTPYKELTMRRFTNGDCGATDSQFCFILFKYGSLKKSQVDTHLLNLREKYKGDPAKFVWVDCRQQPHFVQPFGLTFSCNSPSRNAECSVLVAFRPKRKVFEIMLDELELHNMDRFVESILSGSRPVRNRLQANPRFIPVNQKRPDEL